MNLSKITCFEWDIGKIDSAGQAESIHAAES